MLASAFVGFFGLIFWLAFWIAIIAGMWKVFVKGGQPGWACIIPIYNLYCLLMIAGKPWWWLFLFLIPFVNLVMAILVAIAVAQNFGKSGAFAVGLIFLPFIFYPILGFGDATYQGAAPAAPALA
jgi:Family of unknown function (DUF5684)